MFLAAGIAFKVSAAPFHMWTPDVYEGAPTPVTAFFASAPKMAAVALFTRVMIDAFPTITHQWQQIITFLAIASMVLGAFAAIGQSNIKRLMAYSSIANVGYALVALAAGNEAGVQGVAVFMATYLAMTLGVFACVLALRTENGHAETIDDLAGLARTRPGIAFMLAMLMFSDDRHPAARRLLRQVLRLRGRHQRQALRSAVIGIVSSVVSAFYYLRIVKVMYFDEATGMVYADGDAGAKAVLGVSFAFNFLFAAVRRAAGELQRAPRRRACSESSGGSTESAPASGPGGGGRQAARLSVRSAPPWTRRGAASSMPSRGARVWIVTGYAGQAGRGRSGRQWRSPPGNLAL